MADNDKEPNEEKILKATIVDTSGWSAEEIAAVPRAEAAVKPVGEEIPMAQLVEEDEIKPAQKPGMDRRRFLKRAGAATIVSGGIIAAVLLNSRGQSIEGIVHEIAEDNEKHKLGLNDYLIAIPPNADSKFRRNYKETYTTGPDQTEDLDWAKTVSLNHDALITLHFPAGGGLKEVEQDIKALRMPSVRAFRGEKNVGLFATGHTIFRLNRERGEDVPLELGAAGGHFTFQAKDKSKELKAGYVHLYAQQPEDTLNLVVHNPQNIVTGEIRVHHRHTRIDLREMRRVDYGRNLAWAITPAFEAGQNFEYVLPRGLAASIGPEEFIRLVSERFNRLTRPALNVPVLGRWRLQIGLDRDSNALQHGMTISVDGIDEKVVFQQEMKRGDAKRLLMGWMKRHSGGEELGLSHRQEEALENLLNPPQPSR